MSNIATIPAHLANSRRTSTRSAWNEFARQVMALNPGQFPSEGARTAATLLAAQRLAWSANTSKRHPCANPLSIAHDMARIAQDAPAYAPCRLDRLEFERIALDALHLARKNGGAA